MKVSKMLKKLKSFGLTDTKIAEELGVCQSSINKIRRGIIKDPLHSTVYGIERLYWDTFSGKSKPNGKSIC